MLLLFNYYSIILDCRSNVCHIKLLTITAHFVDPIKQSDMFKPEVIVRKYLVCSTEEITGDFIVETFLEQQVELPV